MSIGEAEIEYGAALGRWHDDVWPASRLVLVTAHWTGAPHLFRKILGPINPCHVRDSLFRGFAKV